MRENCHFAFLKNLKFCIFVFCKNQKGIHTPAMYIERSKNSGCIELVCGSMFSGKTEELIRRLRRARFANMKVRIFKPCIDVRYSEDMVVSHDSKSIPSTPVSDAAEMLVCLNDGTQVVGIDEAQFFGDNLVDVCKELADNGIRVICAGLDMDFMGKPFNPIPALMAVADDVQKVHAICVHCGSPALYSHRLSKDNELVVLGEKDVYEPLCRSCYNKAMSQDK